MKKYLFGLLLLVGLVACDDSETTPGGENLGKKVEMIVVNEGGMGKGLAALSVVYEDGTSDSDIFKTVNKRPLGDVAQSITFINGLYYVALNNSKKVEVVEPETFESVATISYEQEGKPRFITPINDTEALVSDLNKQLVRINTKTYKVIEYIPIDVAIEKMVTVNNKIFGVSGKTIQVFDTKAIKQESVRTVAKLEGSVYKTAKPIIDKNNKIWVLASGGTYFEPKILLHCINPATEEVEYTCNVPVIDKKSAEYVDGCITGIESYPRMDTDRGHSKLYFNVRTLSGANSAYPVVYSFDIDKKELKPYRELPGIGMIYGMGVSPDGDVYVCDCLDYTAQRGFLRQYKMDSEDVVSRRVGIYPRMVYFTEYDK